MNAYRVALILCRAVTVALWWTAGLRLISALAMSAAGISGLFGRGVPVTAFSLQTLIGLVPTAFIAGFLQIFAVSLASSMTGGGAFEGESIAARRALEPSEKIAGNSGAGLFLLFFGLSTTLPAIIRGVYTAVVMASSFGTRATPAIEIYFTISNALPSILQCLVGFVLAFALGLRRLVKAQ